MRRVQIKVVVKGKSHSFLPHMWLKGKRRRSDAGTAHTKAIQPLQAVFMMRSLTKRTVANVQIVKTAKRVMMIRLDMTFLGSFCPISRRVASL